MENNGFFGGAFGSSGSSGGGGGGDTIYTADGTLTGNRAVDFDNKILKFNTNNGGGIGIGKSVVGALGTLITAMPTSAHTRTLNILKASTDGLAVFTDDGIIFNSPTNSKISTEFISLQGSTLIKGNGTSTGSALAIYDNDTTPVKLWDFLDNGNVSVTKSSSFLLSANKTLKVDGSSNINTANVFEVNSGTNSFGQGTFTVGAYGDLIVQGRNSNGNFKVLTILGNELFTLDGNGNNSTLRTKAFDIGTSTTTGYKLSLDAGKHEFIRNTIMGANFDLVNSQVKFWEAGMTSRKFIVGGSALIGTETISLQGDTLLNANVKIPNLPTSSTGLSSGDLWNNNGEVRIGTSTPTPVSSIYTADGTLTGNRAVDLDGNDLSFEGNSGLNIDNTAVNNNKALLSLSKGMSNSETRSTFIEGIQNGSTNNYWKIYQKGSSNFFNNNGIGFYRNNTASQGTEYGMTGINAINSPLYIANYTDSTPRMTLYGGTTDVTGNGYLKFWNYNTSSQRIQIARSGTNFINPDTRTGGVAGLIVMGDTYVGNEKISLQSSTVIKGIGTSTGSTLALYNNDTTPVKTWDFLDDGRVTNSINSGSTNEGLNTNYGITLKNTNSTNDNLQGILFEDNSTNQQVRIYTRFGTKNSLNFDIRDGSFQNAFNYTDNALNIFNNLSADANGNESLTIEGEHSSGIVGSGARIGFKQTGSGLYGAYIKSHTFGAGNTGLGFATGFSANPTVKMTIDGNGSVNINGTLDMNNNRISNTIVNPSVQETTSTATFTINVDEQTDGVLTAMASATTIASPTGTPVQSQNLIFRFKDNGTARALTWNAIFRAIGITLPTTTTANKLLYVGCKYNSTDTKWDVVSVQEEA